MAANNRKVCLPLATKGSGLSCLAKVKPSANVERGVDFMSSFHGVTIWKNETEWAIYKLRILWRTLYYFDKHNSKFLK